MQSTIVKNVLTVLLALPVFAYVVNGCMIANIVYTNSGYISGYLYDHQGPGRGYWCSINYEKNGFDWEGDDGRGYKAARFDCPRQIAEYNPDHSVKKWMDSQAYLTIHTGKNVDVQDKFAVIYYSLGRQMHFGLQWQEEGSRWEKLPYRLTAKVWCAPDDRLLESSG